MTQPLTGLLVLDFTTLLPGPLATLMLAEAGADVVKIERPGGEEMRRFARTGPPWDAAFAMLNAGKRSLVLDLKEPADHARLMPLVERADVLVEQFRPGTMARFALDYETLRAVNPRLVYCSISGYGQSGPRAGEAGHDLNYIGHTGLLSLQPGPPERPVVPPALIADVGGGAFPAVMNILMALRQRDLTGSGSHLDIAMSDAMFTFAVFGLAAAAATGRAPGAGELPLVGASPRYRLYPTRDGKIVACAALEPKFWAAFTHAIGVDPSALGEEANPENAITTVAAAIKSRTAAEWAPILAAADCCATVTASLEEALGDPHFVGRGLFDYRVAATDGWALPALPLPLAPSFRRPPGEARQLAPLGGSNETERG